MKTSLYKVSLMSLLLWLSAPCLLAQKYILVDRQEKQTAGRLGAKEAAVEIRSERGDLSIYTNLSAKPFAVTASADGKSYLYRSVLSLEKTADYILYFSGNGLFRTDFRLYGLQPKEQVVLTASITSIEVKERTDGRIQPTGTGNAIVRFYALASDLDIKTAENEKFSIEGKEQGTNFHIYSLETSARDKDRLEIHIKDGPEERRFVIYNLAAKCFEYYVINNNSGEEKPTDYGLPLTQALQDSMKTLSVARIIEKAYEYTDAFDEENATLYWYIGALRGSAIAQTELGTCFFTGRGVPEADFYKAFYWFQKAAVQGDSFALNNLGICYDEGKGVSQDITKAFECFEKAAMQNPDGGSPQCNLAKRYELGHGTPKNLKLAEEWYRKAAEKGNEEARIRLKNLLDSK